MVDKFQETKISDADAGVISTVYEEKYKMGFFKTPHFNTFQIKIKEGKYKAIINRIEYPDGIENIFLLPSEQKNHPIENMALKKDGTIRMSGQYKGFWKDVEAKGKALFAELHKAILKEDDF